MAFGQAYPELRGTVRRLSRRSRFAVEATWREALESQGLPRDIAEDVLNLTLNQVRGFMVRRFMDDNPAQRAHLTKVWQDMIRAYLVERLGQEDLAKALPSAGPENRLVAGKSGKVTRPSGRSLRLTRKKS